MTWVEAVLVGIGAVGAAWLLGLSWPLWAFTPAQNPMSKIVAIVRYAL